MWLKPSSDMKMLRGFPGDFGYSKKWKKKLFWLWIYDRGIFINPFRWMFCFDRNTEINESNSVHLLTLLGVGQMPQSQPISCAAILQGVRCDRCDRLTRLVAWSAPRRSPACNTHCWRHTTRKCPRHCLSNVHPQYVHPQNISKPSKPLSFLQYSSTITSSCTPPLQGLLYPIRSNIRCRKSHIRAVKPYDFCQAETSKQQLRSSKLSNSRMICGCTPQVTRAFVEKSQQTRRQSSKVNSGAYQSYSLCRLRDSGPSVHFWTSTSLSG